MGMLERYRMLDLTRLVVGPFASHILADLGMDVIKVEEPEPRYGMARDTMTPYQPTPEGERRASAFNIVARNKKSIAIDLLNPALRPLRMDDRWIDSFSTLQKKQWVEFARRLEAFFHAGGSIASILEPEPPEDDQ